MSLFGKIVRTAVNVASLPVAVVKDVITLGNTGSGEEPYAVQVLRKLKDEAEDDGMRNRLPK